MTKKEDNKLFRNFLVSFLKKNGNTVELLTENNTCPSFQVEKSISPKGNYLGNFRFILDWLGKQNLFPEVALNLSRNCSFSKSIELLKKYDGKKKIILSGRRDDDLNFPPEIQIEMIGSIRNIDKNIPQNIEITCLLDFDLNDLKKNIAKVDKKNLSNLRFKERKKSHYGKEDFQNLRNLVEFLINYFYETADKNIEKYRKILNKNKGFGFFPGYGKGCWANRKLYINLRDLSVVFCPNLTCSGFEYGRFSKNGTLEALNVELMIAIFKSDLKDLPLCETCLVNDFCTTDCFVSQWVKSGDIFTPHPEHCQYEHKKIYYFLNQQEQLGLNSKMEKDLKKNIETKIKIYD